MTTQSIKITVDAIVIRYEKKKGISVLLVKRKYGPYQGKWAIPGGFVMNNEALENAVLRELKEETGIDIETRYLEQLYTFGRPDRDPRERVVSVAYFVLVGPEKHQPVAGSDAGDVGWFDVKNTPLLAFDHKEILEVAINRLKSKVTYEPIGFELLEEKFPFSDLEDLYSTLLDRDIDRRNFRKKILSFGMLDQLDEKVSTGAGRPAHLFQFNKAKYFQLKTKGIVFEV